MPVPLDRLSGTLGHGQMRLDPDHRLAWKAAWWDSLTGGALALNITLIGPGTDLAGRVKVGPIRQQMGPVNGMLAWPLAAAIVPASDITCDLSAIIQDLTLVQYGRARSGTGNLRSGQGSCMRPGVTEKPVPVPALIVRISPGSPDIVAVVTTRDEPEVPLVTGRLTDADRIMVTIHRAGAAMVPGMPSSSDSELDIPLAVLLQ
ncbi:MAG: hypothetical protein ACK46Q_00740 [Hyphomonas sp.]